MTLQMLGLVERSWQKMRLIFFERPGQAISTEVKFFIFF